MLKKVITGAALASLVISGAANADFLGAKMGVDYTNSTLKENGSKVAKHKGNYRLYANFEHFIPMIPNAEVDYQLYGNSEHGYKKTSATGYYQLFDNSIFSFDAGLGASYFSSMKFIQDHGTETSPHLHSSFNIHIPGTDTSLFANGKWYGVREVSGHDLTLGSQLTLDLPLNPGLRFGYNFSDVNFKSHTNTKVKSDGWFLGMNISL